VLGEDNSESKNVRIGQAAEAENESDEISRIYDLSIGKYDVVVDTGPNYTTKRQEAAEQMTEMMRVYPQAAPLIADLLAKNLDWPGAEDIAKRFKAMLPPQVLQSDDGGAESMIMQQANQQMEQMQQQMQQMQQQAQQAIQQAQAEVQELQQKIGVLSDKSQIDAQKLLIEGYKAETDRLQVTQQSMTPEMIQQIVMQQIQNILNTPDPAPMQQDAVSGGDMPQM
jgi:hypothetical protein